ncbi:MAG: HAD family hydrolase [Gammaproteobacteria bacterium]
MSRRLIPRIAILAIVLAAGCGGPALEPAPNVDPLPSWNDGAPRTAILGFVARVTDANGPDFVAPAERIAVVDNDGTLIIEQPSVVQFEFLYARIRRLSPEHPEWSDSPALRAVMDNDRQALADMTFRERGDLVTKGQANVYQQDFARAVQDFLATGRHSRFGERYVDLAYQPMLELIRLLQANDFRVFVVSGGGIDFIREFSEPVYGIARENVIGSSMKTAIKERDGRLEVYRKPGWDSLNAGPFKPLNIQLHIGRRPILAVGNSDGDLDMLQYAHDGTLPSLVLLLKHDDAEREYVYAEEAQRALEVAEREGWSVVSMRDDFATVFAP